MDTKFRKCRHCRHEHPSDYFRGDKCHDCRTEGVEPHRRRIEDALNRRLRIQYPSPQIGA